jgi:BMFP domain-containing protein YqiC
MQSDNRFLDDAARVASGALGAFTGVRRELEQLARHQIERVLATMNLVTRDEFETVKAMAAKARAGQEELGAKVAALEAALAERDRPAAETEPRR